MIRYIEEEDLKGFTDYTRVRITRMTFAGAEAFMSFVEEEGITVYLIDVTRKRRIKVFAERGVAYRFSPTKIMLADYMVFTSAYDAIRCKLQIPEHSYETVESVCSIID